MFKKSISYLIFSISIILFFSTCDYEEEKDEDNKKISFRIASVEVTGEVTGLTSETYTYDDDGLLVEIIRKDNDGEPVNTTIYDYNDEAQIIRETFTDLSVEPTQIVKTLYEYTDGQKVTSESTDMSTGIILNKTSYYYDTVGRLVKKEVKKASNELIGSVNFEYEELPAVGEGKELTEYTLSKQ